MKDKMIPGQLAVLKDFIGTPASYTQIRDEWQSHTKNWEMVNYAKMTHFSKSRCAKCRKKNLIIRQTATKMIKYILQTASIYLFYINTYKYLLFPN